MDSSGWWTVLAHPFRAAEWTLENYRLAIDAQGFGSAFLNSLAVTIPSTVIPITIAAFAAYAFSWMHFRGRDVLFITVVALLVVPLQMAMIPILRLYNSGATIGRLIVFPDLDLVGSRSSGCGWRTRGSGCRWRSTSCGTSSDRSRHPSSSRRGSMAPTTSRSSGGS